jgi:hypothetical protein
MAHISPFLSIDSSWEKALHSIQASLSEAGFSTVQTFNLHATQRSSQGCGCPIHGTEQCDCQMIVLLVYGEPAEPATLMLHGNHTKTWLSIPESAPPVSNPGLIDTIRKVLDSSESPRNKQSPRIQNR